MVGIIESHSDHATKQSITMKKEKIILHDHNRDGLDRRGFLECMAWAGTGMIWTASGGLLGSMLLPGRAAADDMAGAAGTIAKGSFSFVQISDSHIGFNKEAINKDVVGTLQAAIA